MVIRGTVFGIDKYSPGNKKSIILLSVIIIFLTLSIIGTGLVSFSFSLNLDARFRADEAKALSLAEAGIAHAIFILHNQAESMDQLQKQTNSFALGEGTYEFEIDLNSYLITSTGKVGDTERTVQLVYKPL